MNYRDVTFDPNGGLSLTVPYETNSEGLKIMVRQAPHGVICVDTMYNADVYRMLLSRILRGLCSPDEPRFVSPIQPLPADQLDCRQRDDDLRPALTQLFDDANIPKGQLADRLKFAGERLRRDVDEDFCNELANYIPCGDGEDLVEGARKLRDELVRVKSELAAVKAGSGTVKHLTPAEAATIDSAVAKADGGASPFGTTPTEPQVEVPRRGRRPAKPKDDPTITNTVTVPKPAAAPVPDVSAHQAAAPPTEPVVVPDPKPMGLTDQLIHLLSEPPMPIGVDPLDDRDQQGNYCDSAFMRLYYRQDVCRSQAIARQAAGYDHKTWRPQKPPEMLVEMSDKGAETLADVFFQLVEASGDAIPQLKLWVTLQGTRAAAADAIKAKYAQIRARAKRS